MRWRARNLILHGAIGCLAISGRGLAAPPPTPVPGERSVLTAGAPEPPAAVPPAPAADGTTSVMVKPATLPPSVVVPARNADPPGAAVSGVSGDLLAQALEPPPGGPVAAARAGCRPLPLLEALQRSGDRGRRLWIAQSYWKVSVACAQLQVSTEAVERLELIAPGGDPHDRATLDVAVASARADVADARAVLGAAQQELVDLARLPVTEPLPWPVDRPLSIPYQTHFETVFATRAATGRVRAIARTLPARHEALETRATAVRAAATAMTMAEADHAKGRRPIEAVVAAHAALVAQQREFLLATRAYNLDIAEYAMAAADLSLPDDRFAAMLIGAPVPWQPPAAVTTGAIP